MCFLNSSTLVCHTHLVTEVLHLVTCVQLSLVTLKVKIAAYTVITESYWLLGWFLQCALIVRPSISCKAHYEHLSKTHR